MNKTDLHCTKEIKLGKKMNGTEYIKKAIEDFEGKKIVRMNTKYTPDDWDEYRKGDHLAEIDGEESFSSQVSEWNERRPSETVVVFQDKKDPSNVILLRMIGNLNKNGEHYMDEQWTPEGAFGNHKPSVWNYQQKVQMLRHRYYDVNENDVLFVNVGYENPDGEEEGYDFGGGEDCWYCGSSAVGCYTEQRISACEECREENRLTEKYNGEC